MKEVRTIAGVTPDAEWLPWFPNAVREWCINSAAVDPATGSVLANSEDGRLYRWDLATNSFTQSIALTSGVGEAYTPTMIGADGKSYAINNAVLFAIGANVQVGVGDGDAPPPEFALAPAQPTPFVDATVLRFSLPREAPTTLEIVDLAGRRVAMLVDAPLPAGTHTVRWDGRDQSDRAVGAGVYFVRLTAGPLRASGKVVRSR
jgi:hypothetical protein